MDFEDKIIEELGENEPSYKLAATLIDFSIVSGTEAYILIDIFICNFLRLNAETGRDDDYQSTNLALEMLRLVTGKNQAIVPSKRRKTIMAHIPTLDNRHTGGELERFVFKLDDPFFKGVNLQIGANFWFTITEHDHIIGTKIISATNDVDFPNLSPSPSTFA